MRTSWASGSSTGYGAATVTVLEQLGGLRERVTHGVARDWNAPPGDPLNVIAVDCGAGPRTSVAPGLPDDAYESDGQLTKREVRAVTLAMLATRISGAVPAMVPWLWCSETQKRW